ncbi:MAG: septum formation initiator family protein [candidate division KSB1 bacterium]|nr:septum formation initiator family protein [candidate division KSB1 bacterium]MDZ7319449.1 septum formation initiator family protein [candidate division KSB1 bacterium]MDZ7340560.1 septum formation initiator family protein [candidate division KSB1 bacterium]
MIKKKRAAISRSRRRPFKWRPWHFLLLAGIAFFSYVFLFSNHGLLRYLYLLRRKKLLQQEIAVLREEQMKLQQEIERLTDNYRYIEKIAREKYQMGKPGEKIYFITSPENKK